jgi:hypothetical protein
VFAHSYTFPQHEQLVGRLAKEVGFTQVSESAALLPMIRLVPRGVSSTADAYLTPVLRAYLDGFFQGFDAKLKNGDGPRVEFMGSDGGLLDLQNFSGLKSILSGPAGGVVGYALTSWDDEFKHPIIGYVRICLCVLLIDPLSQSRRRRNVDGCVSVLGPLRGHVRDNHGRRVDSVSAARHQHRRRWRRIMFDFPDGLVSGRTRECWCRARARVLQVDYRSHSAKR